MNILNYNKPSNTINLPSGLYEKHKEIFEKTSQPFKNSKIDYSSCVYERKQGHSSKNNHIKENSKWKKQEKDEESNDFFDNFKGKFNQIEVNNLRRQMIIESNHEVSLHYNGKRLIDNKRKTFSVDDFFDEESSEKPFIKSNVYLNIGINECINKVNEKLKYSMEKPLWYIYHEGAESSYGPLSSKNIIEMLEIKMLNEQSKIRLIDVYVYRGKEQFKFFNIKDIKLDNFIDNIRVSDLAKLEIK